MGNVRLAHKEISAFSFTFAPPVMGVGHAWVILVGEETVCTPTRNTTVTTPMGPVNTMTEESSLAPYNEGFDLFIQVPSELLDTDAIYEREIALGNVGITNQAALDALTPGVLPAFVDKNTWWTGLGTFYIVPPAVSVPRDPITPYPVSPEFIV